VRACVQRNWQTGRSSGSAAGRRGGTPCSHWLTACRQRGALGRPEQHGAVRNQGAPHERVALPLLVVMAQQRRRIARDTDSPHLKLIAELYDKCDLVLLQARA